MNHPFETDTPGTTTRPASRRPRRALVSLLLALPMTAGAGVLVAHATTPEPTSVRAAPVADVMEAGAPAAEGGDEGAVVGDDSVDAFFGAGYDYADAEQLAALWSSSSVHDAKVLAGEKVIRGEDLPFHP